ncbi:DNA-binding NarL/FixJ family response regulator [Arcanobacterium wilhelmae]|uniref:DNA-binding NarL/FixJ family response regulator n=1 Tax=Arcanobacterium wilhelmae TaxID=1803177 RepID=A0ABT9N9M4_9ACTO|nr:response regulator transcription factor [Arcanobacterium wilhelmae]MDP9800404.1 DNA-binding NarL/FixJ family response regulator [Arcanobacterium wilhelmae]WFN89833.1 response regulator transcription factor [Arcanobacterium wilhelmae]
MTIRVGLVDDQVLVRSGFAMVIDSQDDMEIVMEAGNGKTALERLALVPADVVLMDIRMPDMDGITATEQLTSREFPHGVSPKVVILTTFDIDEYVMAAIKAGASGFLLKDAPPDDLLAAIRTVYNGDAVIAPAPTKRLVEKIAANQVRTDSMHPEILDDLTDRERDVLILMAKGYSNQEIAAKLYVAEATVKTHVGRIFSKLGARDRVQAVVAAFEAGIVTPGASDDE